MYFPTGVETLLSLRYSMCNLDLDPPLSSQLQVRAHVYVQIIRTLCAFASDPRLLRRSRRVRFIYNAGTKLIRILTIPILSVQCF